MKTEDKGPLTPEAHYLLTRYGRWGRSWSRLLSDVDMLGIRKDFVAALDGDEREHLLRYLNSWLSELDTE